MKDPVLIALDHIPADDYRIWIKVGMILKDAGYPWATWDMWSMGSEKYEVGVTETKWETFGYSDKRATLGTLFHIAKDYGFDIDDYRREQIKTPPSPPSKELIMNWNLNDYRITPSLQGSGNPLDS